MRPCIYCYRSVDPDEPGAAYMIEDEDLVLWCHEECLEMVEEVVIQDRKEAW